MTRALSLASDGLLGGSSLSIATRGHLGIVVRLPRRRLGGHPDPGPKIDEVQIPKQKVVYQPYDDSDDILLIMTVI